MKKKLVSGMLTMSMCLGMMAGIPAMAASEEAAVDGAGETISVLCHSSWRTSEAKEVFDYVADKCNVVFEFEEVPEGTAGEELIAAKIQSGEVPDILWWQGATTSINVLGDCFEELNRDDWTENYSDAVLDSYKQSYEGRMLCAPFGDVTVFGMVYNKQIFADNNLEIPTTWDELMEECETLKEKGIIPVYTSGAADNEWTLQIISIDSRAKQEIQTPGAAEKLNTHKALWTDMEYEKYALEKQMELIDKGYTNETFLSDTYADAQEALITGQAAMYPSATFITSEIQSIAESDEEFENIGMFVLPSNEADSDKALLAPPNGFLIPKGTEKADLVKQLLLELCSPEAMNVYYQNHSGIPSVNGVEVDFKGISADVYQMIQEDKTFPEPELLGSAQSLPKNLQAMVSGTKTPEEVLESLDSDFDIWAKENNIAEWGY